MLRVLKLFAAAVVMMVAASGANAQSFNCNYAKTPDEIVICQDSMLSQLDEDLSTFYYELHNRAYDWRRRTMEFEQSSWLRWRTSCGRDVMCIARAYRDRIQELREQQRSVCTGPGPYASETFCSVSR